MKFHPPCRQRLTGSALWSAFGSVQGRVFGGALGSVPARAPEGGPGRVLTRAPEDPFGRVVGQACVCVLVGALGYVLWSAAPPAHAATFDPAAVAPDLGLAAFDQRVAEQQLGRRLFGTPYASVVVGNVDIYDVFPYVESRYFVIVSDPEWNRLVVTATGSGRVTSFDGVGESCGALLGPRGLAVDDFGRVYVCDTGNDRVLILQASPEFDRLDLTPVGEIGDVSQPYGVAVSDAGTRFDPSDDLVYVAESGRNQVSRFEASPSATMNLVRSGSVGGLGSGVGRFAGPMAVAVGQGQSRDRVYVADAHNRRLVELIDDGTGLHWGGEVAIDASLVTGLATDRWGHVYTVAPLEGRVTKFSPQLETLAEEPTGARPRSFHVPVVTTTDHRSGEQTRSAEGRGLLIEDWGPGSGLRALSLGVAVTDLVPNEDAPLAASFFLTDPAQVHVRLETYRGEVLARRDLGLLEAGRQEVAFLAEDLVAGADGPEDGRARWVVEARSTYADRTPTVTMADTRWSGEVGFSSGKPLFRGSFPNPFVDGTSFRLVLPNGTKGVVEAEVFDLTGRLIRRLVGGQGGGSVDLHWDGRDERGNELGSGVYFYTLRGLDREWQGRVVRVR